jgi:hypothetical protein
MSDHSVTPRKVSVVETSTMLAALAEELHMATVLGKVDDRP